MSVQKKYHCQGWDGKAARTEGVEWDEDRHGMAWGETWRDDLGWNGIKKDEKRQREMGWNVMGVVIGVQTNWQLPCKCALTLIFPYPFEGVLHVTHLLVVIECKSTDVQSVLWSSYFRNLNTLNWIYFERVVRQNKSATSPYFLSLGMGMSTTCSGKLESRRLSVHLPDCSLGLRSHTYLDEGCNPRRRLQISLKLSRIHWTTLKVSKHESNL